MARLVQIARCPHASWDLIQGEKLEQKRSRGALAAMSIALFIGAQFVMVNVAHAKAAKCTAVQVPGKSGVFVVNCSTKRP